MDKYLERLNETGMCLMIYESDKLVFQSNSNGVRPHLEAIDQLGTRLKGSIMADKIVGRAAALLMLFSGAAEVHADVITRAARELMEQSKVKLHVGEQTEHIKMVDGRIYCPFEAMVQGIDNPEQAYHAIRDKIQSLSFEG